MGKDKKRVKDKRSKHKKHRSSRKEYSSSSDDSSSSGNEWVEMGTNSKKSPDEEKRETETRHERDDWMSNPALFACVTRGEIKEKDKKKKDRSEEEKYMLDKLGQTDRELNPYWKDGGSGLPEEKPTSTASLQQAAATVGDQGVAWLRKALQRAKEQAADQGRPLEQVVAERWGSLQKLESMIAAAEERENGSSQNYKRSNNYRSTYNKEQTERSNKNQDHKRYDRNYKGDGKKSHFSKPKCSDESEDDEYTRKNKTRSREEERKSDSKSKYYDDKSWKKEYEKSEKEKRLFSKPKDSSEESSDDRHKREKHSTSKHCSRKKSKHSSSSSDSSSSEEETYRKDSKSHKKFSKPRESSSEEDRKYNKNKFGSSHESEEKRKQSKRSFAKPHHDSDDESSDRNKYKYESRKSYSSSGWRKKKDRETQPNENRDKIKKTDEQHRTEDKRYDDVKVESVKKETVADKVEENVLTDKEMNDLAAKLVKAELLGNQDLANELKAKLEKAREVKSSRPKDAGVKEEVVILTHTDAKGFTRPVSLGEFQEPRGGRRKANKVETHSDGKRMRYFADDDKYNLQEMFQREKLSTVEDSNAVFAKLASKGVGRDDSARDMEDVFEETARVEESEGRRQQKDRDQAIQESKRVAKSLDNCQWCLESREMLKHLIIAIGNKCYLCVPPYQSLTENHCLIVPSCHSACATQIDEDVWAEMQDFRKALVKMFLSQDEDVVFFESARYLNKFPHMVLNCVPMPKETGDLAPIYFKKAIQECEMEWSNNKKLVDLRGKDVRRAVPKGLPYFAVDFGTESGFAHVIEDEKLFPQNFAQEIIGGMLDLDHTIWRKQRRQTFEEQSKKVIKLSKLWSPFDITKNK